DSDGQHALDRAASAPHRLDTQVEESIVQPDVVPAPVHPKLARVERLPRRGHSVEGLADAPPGPVGQRVPVGVSQKVRAAAAYDALVYGVDELERVVLAAVDRDRVRRLGE